MKNTDERDQPPEAPRNRLSQLSEASLRINESLDLGTVLQEILDSARLLTGARCGVIVSVDEGQVEDFLASGLTDEETQQVFAISEGMKIFEYLTTIPGPLRVPDIASLLRSQGLSFRSPIEISLHAYLGAPIRHRGEYVGHIYLGKSEPGQEFTREDEETLVLFASQAALVIGNVRKYRDERRARANLETLIDTSPIGVVVFDVRTGAIVSINREAGRIIEGLQTPGYSLEQLLDVVTVRRWDGSEVSLDKVSLTQVLSTDEIVRAEEIILKVPDGRSVTTLVNATPIRSQDGETESLVVTLQDLTSLDELGRLRAELLGMVSHELRVPLTSIRGSATTLLNTSSGLAFAELRQFHQIIADQADHMSELIGDLLDVARIETGTLPVAPEPVAITSLVDRARNTFLSSGGKHDLDLDLALDLPLVMADRQRIVQVLSNLLSNAARLSPAPAVIRVTAVPEDFHVAITVADEGAGIAAEQLPLLFRKFARTHQTGERETGGSGLGLAICKGIVEAHGGRIWAESDGPGQGARFTFTLPVVEEAGSKATTQSPWRATRSRLEPSEEVRILGVDDDPQALRYIRDALSEAGFTPIVTSDPKEALLLTEEQKPHLVLLDLVLLDADGIDLMKDILCIANVPVIFVSGYGKDQVIAQAFEQGATDYIVKPFSPTELVARIRAALRRQANPYGIDLSGLYVLGDLTIDYAQRRVTVANRPVELTPIEYGVLFELSVNAGRAVTHDRLLRRVWGSTNSGDVRVIRPVVRNLRLKLDDDANSPTYIFTELRVGYRMPKGQEPG